MGIELAVVELVVADMATSLGFYRLLGLALPAGVDGEDHVEVELPGGLKLAFDTVPTIRSFDPDWAPPTGGHRMALAFRCDDPAGVDAAYATIVGANHHGHLAPFDAFWGQRYAVVVDPDGNHVDLFAPR